LDYKKEGGVKGEGWARENGRGIAQGGREEGGRSRRKGNWRGRKGAGGKEGTGCEGSGREGEGREVLSGKIGRNRVEAGVWQGVGGGGAVGGRGEVQGMVYKVMMQTR